MATIPIIPEAAVTAQPRAVRHFPSALTGALVVGGAHGSLGVVRSLGRRGVPVWVLAGDQSVARYSRFARKSFAWPGPDDAHALEYLLKLAERHNLRGWVLFPGGDSEAR